MIGQNSKPYVADVNFTDNKKIFSCHDKIFGYIMKLTFSKFMILAQLSKFEIRHENKHRTNMVLIVVLKSIKPRAYY